MPSLFDRNIFERSAPQHFQNSPRSKKKGRKQREIRKSRKYTENLRHLQIVTSAKREEGKRWGRRSETEVVTESIHKFTTTFHLPDFCQLPFFVIYVSFHTFRIYTRYLSFGLFIPVLAFHQLIINGHPTPRIAVGLLFISKKHCLNMQNLQIYKILATASVSSGRYRSFSSHWYPTS